MCRAGHCLGSPPLPLLFPVLFFICSSLYYRRIRSTVPTAADTVARTLTAQSGLSSAVQLPQLSIFHPPMAL
ncbi:hypothetical protein CALVIDRAFT_536360 [Calocera viscosa TUFC12733]|uniref:Uncharacterized protein n=1 Tax=Calocera viscosa (strain TUFC12733) TaxID=1330018 RepID=A0A167N4M4_CALVF|nr:hypothetical protein CALVIDRAFT_536360 [Calocera viscosa TUFC12733]